jgi:hypothetical protein
MSRQSLSIRRNDHEDRMDREPVGIEVAPGRNDRVRIRTSGENIQRRDLKLTDDLTPPRLPTITATSKSLTNLARALT